MRPTRNLELALEPHENSAEMGLDRGEEKPVLLATHMRKFR